jgi:hypothetical protein
MFFSLWVGWSSPLSSFSHLRRGRTVTPHSEPSPKRVPTLGECECEFVPLPLLIGFKILSGLRLFDFERLDLELSPNFGDGLRVQAATVRD